MLRKVRRFITNGLIVGSICLLIGCEEATKTADKVVADVEEKVQAEMTKDNEILLSVKNGTLTNYPDIKIDDAFTNFFSSPTWKYFQAETGEHVVEFTGYCTYVEKEVKAKLQFLVEEGEESFEIGALEFNEVPQNELNKLALLAAIYEDETLDEVNTAEEKEITESTPTESIKNLQSFEKWSYGDPDKIIPISLDGEQKSIILGLDSPNGIKTQVQINSINSVFDLPLDSESEFTPFDELGELLPGFDVYALGYDFDSDDTDEVIIAVSDGLIETYFWVFSYDFMALEYGDNPLIPIFYGEGQSDIILEDNTLTVPYGSQGLFEEYIYSNYEFIMQ